MDDVLPVSPRLERHREHADAEPVAAAGVPA
jgi:hypothetical protein